MNTPISANRFPRRHDAAAIRSNGYFSLARFESDPGINGREAVDAVVASMDSTRLMDGASQDQNPTTGQVALCRDHNVASVRSAAAADSTTRIIDEQSLSFDTSGTVTSFSQNFHYAGHAGSVRGEGNLEVRRGFWLDDLGREHYLQSRPNETTDVVIDRRNGTVCVLTDSFSPK